jgi:hypothetical protein
MGEKDAKRNNSVVNNEPERTRERLSEIKNER